MIIYKIRVLFIFIFLFFCFIGTKADTISYTPIKPANIKIACWKHNEPYTYINKEGLPSGIFIDIWKKWSKETNINVSFEFYETLEKSLNALKTLKADIHSGLRKVDSRKKYLIYANRRFFPGRLSIFYAGYNTPVTLKNIKNGKLGLINNSFAHYFVSKNYPKINVVTYDNTKQIIQDVLSGKIRAFISSEPNILKFLNAKHLEGSIKKTPGFYLNKDFFTAVANNRKYLLRFIYEGLSCIKPRDLLEIEANYIYSPSARYFSQSNHKIELTKEEKQWINNKKQIIVGYASNNTPVEFKNDENQFSGITRDFLKELNKKIHLNFVFKEISPQENSQILGELEKQTYDIITSLTFRKIDSSGLFTNTMSFAALDIVYSIKKDSNESKFLNFDKKIIACQNPFVHNFITSLYQNNKIIRVNSVKEGLMIVKNKHADLFIGDLPSIKYSISELKTDKIDIIYETIVSQELSFTLRKEDQILKAILNKAIIALDGHTSKEIVNKWSNIIIKEKTNWSLVISIGIPILVACLVAYILLLITFKEVKKRTEAQNQLINAQKKLVATNFKINKFWKNISNKMTSAFLHIGFELSDDKQILRTITININSKFEDLIDLKRKDIINKSSDKILKTLNIVLKKELLKSIINKQEYRFDSLNSKLEKHLDFLVIPIDSNQFVILITDITDKKQNEISLLEAQKMESIAQLAGSIAHDFNNQLMGIMGYSNLLKDQIEDPELKYYASVIIEGAKKSAGLTNQLLAFSRKGKYRNVSVNIHTTLNNIVKMFKQKNPNLNLFLNANAEKYNISGEPQLIHNAFLNIIINSYEAIPENGNINITTYNTNQNILEDNPPEENSKEYIIIEIIDNGPGIETSKINNIFEPFYSTKNTGVGQGLGLPAARGAILSHHGTITVENLPETGCKFNIALPLSKISAKKIVTPKALKKNNNTKDKANIVIVDDEDIVRSIVKDMLVNSDNNVISFSNGIDAISYYRDNYSKIDLVLLDIIMPEMSGKEVFYNLQKINSNVNVIIFSGYTMDNSIQELLDKGVKDFIHKPVNKNLLLKKISQVLNENEECIETPKPQTTGTKSLDCLKSIFTDTDVDLALKNLGQDSELYVKLISRFYEKYPDLISNLRISLKEDIEAAYITVHSFKSLAATLGRYKLQNASVRLERAIQNEEDKSYPLQIFEQEFLLFMKEIKQFFDNEYS